MLLAAAIHIPPNAIVAAAHFVCRDPALANAPDILENARRRLPKSGNILNNPLFSVQLGAKPALYVFSVVSPDSVTVLDDLHFDGLVAAQNFPSRFPFQMIYEQPHQVISHFLHAVRTRLIDNIVLSNTGVQRCKDGFLISYQNPTTGSTDWGTGWEYKAFSRPLIFCYIQLQPTPSTILIRPTLLPTPFLPLGSCLPLLPRSPILLLPYATPAYFLTTYSGPTSVLTRQFAESLQGHGQPSLGSSFIIGWISVENRRGEDKGITFIYPTRLCLAFLPALNRPLLDYTPDLPGPLQPSPKLQSATTPLSECFPEYPHRPSILGSPSTELTAFRALTLSKSKNIRVIAAQISSYVDHVAKDRERERERLKREREGGNSPSLLSRTTPSTSTAVLPPAPPVPPSLSVHTPTPTQATITSQNFYPSPPQADTTTGPVPDNTSPVLPAATQLQVTQQPSTTSAPAQPPPLSSSSSSSYDPFGYLDIGMDFGMDVGMNFGMGMSMNLGGGSGPVSNETGTRSAYNDDSGRGMGLGGSSGMDFEDFTDDDFNFFDQPSVPAPAPHPRPELAASSNIPLSTPLQVTSPPLFGDVHGSGPGPPLPISHSLPTPASHAPWSSNFPEGFTPLSVEHMDSVVPPESLPPLPGSTPLAMVENCPIAPHVHLEQEPWSHTPDVSIDESRKSFDPIPFARSHRLADGKYASTGKFALPSPPPDEPDIPPAVTPFIRGKSPIVPRPPLRRAETTSTKSWRNQYDAITDPRVGVVRKLIGVKRKNPTQGGRTGKDVRKSPWTMEHEEWSIHRSSSTPDVKNFESESSEDEASHSEGEFSEEEEDTPATSRPSTPPPSYLPLGPTLLHTQFHHTQLLPLSKPLRPPGSSLSGPVPQGGVGSTPMTIINVPTPVSPAAGLGLTAEKWRTLETVINVVAREVIENVVWRDAWMASNMFDAISVEGKKYTEIWVSDVKIVERMFGNLEGVKGGLSVKDVFGLDSAVTIPNSSNDASPALRILSDPKLLVAKGDAILSVLPPALRFWEKLGLGPKNGEKDGIVYALFADEGEQYRPAEVASWLAGVCTAYETKHLGKLVPGTSQHCKDGLVPMKFDFSFRKLFTTFATSLSGASTPILLFLIVPINLMSLSSSPFRQILSSMQKTLKSLPENQVLVQLVPEYVINYLENDVANMSQLESFCVNLYNRILIPVDRPLARVFSPDNTPISVKTYIQKPIFTLARPLYNKVTYVRRAHASLDVLDRYTLVHVGYRTSVCRKWVMAACVDQRGEAWDQAVWLVKNDHHDPDGERSGIGGGGAASVSGGGNSEEALVVRKVWDFLVGFARRADVEWRVVICKLGIMEEAELTAWTTLLPAVAPVSGLGAMHISLTCADPDSPWTLTQLDSILPNPRSTIKSPSNKHTVFSDISSTTYSLSPTVTLPIAIPPRQADLGLSLPYVVDSSGAGNGLNDADVEGEATSPTSTTIATPTTASVPTSLLSPSPALTTSSIPHPVGLLPQSTTCLIRVPRSQPASITMLHIHLLWTYCPTVLTKRSSMLDPTTIHADVTKNFYELSVLAQSRWKMSAPGDGSSIGITDSGNGNVARVSRTDVNPILPLHLAMVELMSRVTECADGAEIDR